MRSHITDSDALGAVPASGLRAYLIAQGWTQSDEIEEIGYYYRNDDNIELIVPSTPKLRGYASVVGEIVRLLSEVEQRTELQILRDITQSDSDIIRFRLPEADPDGSVSVEQGLELVQQSRDMLLSAACAAIEPKKAYYAGKVVKAVEYLRDVRMGQSEKGSYILTLVSPVPPMLASSASQPLLWPDLSEEPFARQVTRMLSKSLHAMNSALKEVNAGKDITAFESVVREGVSANICESAARLIEHGEGLDVTLTWARTRSGPDPIHRFKFVEDDKEVLKEVARLLKNKEPRESEKLEGYVEHLSRKSEQSEGQVTLKVMIDDKLTSVVANFDELSYSKIVEAHDKRKAITIEGDLLREGQRWRLQSPRHLKIQNDEDDGN